MADLTMCVDAECPRHMTCMRFIAEPSNRDQSYFSKSPRIGKTRCDVYWVVAADYVPTNELLCAAVEASVNPVVVDPLPEEKDFLVLDEDAFVNPANTAPLSDKEVPTHHKKKKVVKEPEVKTFLVLDEKGLRIEEEEALNESEPDKTDTPSDT